MARRRNPKARVKFMAKMMEATSKPCLDGCCNLSKPDVGDLDHHEEVGHGGEEPPPGHDASARKVAETAQEGVPPPSLRKHQNPHSLILMISTTRQPERLQKPHRKGYPPHP